MKPESVEKIKQYNKELKTDYMMRFSHDDDLAYQFYLREMIIEVIKEEKLFDTFMMEHRLKKLKEQFGGTALTTQWRGPKRREKK